jgi:hypothetical protein
MMSGTRQYPFLVPAQPRWLAALAAALIASDASAQSTTRMVLPLAVWGAIAGVALLIILLIAYIISMAMKETAPRRNDSRSSRGGRGSSSRSSSSRSAKGSRSSKVDNPAWRETGKGRRARDPTENRESDDDLPPITVMTGATWADKDQPPAVPRQSSLIAAAAPAPVESNVYKTGYNPFFRQSDTDKIQVEEVADLVQQAELMVTLDNFPAAISMLTRHIRDTEAPSPKAWLMLFDLYAKTEREDQYTNLAKGFRIQFNADVPTWNAQKTEKPRSLEDYPRVMDRVIGAWNTKDIRALLNSLLFDDRGGSRQGFMLEAYSDLILLLDLVDLLGTIEREIEERREIEMKLQSKPLV